MIFFVNGSDILVNGSYRSKTLASFQPRTSAPFPTQRHNPMSCATVELHPSSTGPHDWTLRVLFPTLLSAGVTIRVRMSTDVQWNHNGGLLAFPQAPMGAQLTYPDDRTLFVELDAGTSRGAQFEAYLHSEHLTGAAAPEISCYNVQPAPPPPSPPRPPPSPPFFGVMNECPMALTAQALPEGWAGQKRWIITVLANLFFVPNARVYLHPGSAEIAEASELLSLVNLIPLQVCYAAVEALLLHHRRQDARHPLTNIRPTLALDPDSP